MGELFQRLGCRKTLLQNARVKFGYARVSTLDQDSNLQRDALKGGRFPKPTLALPQRMHTSSADFQFAIRLILHPQRTAGMRAADAAFDRGAGRRLWADFVEKLRILDAVIFRKEPVRPKSQMISAMRHSELVHERQKANLAEPLASKISSHCTGKNFSDFAKNGVFQQYRPSLLYAAVPDWQDAAIDLMTAESPVYSMLRSARMAASTIQRDKNA